MAIGGNAVHFTHGLSDESFYGSMPVLSADVRGDPSKIKTLTSYIAMLLKVDPRTVDSEGVPIDIPAGETVLDRDMIIMAKEFIRAIRELEDAIIKDAS